MGPRGLTASRAPRPFLDGEDFKAAESGRRGKGSALGWPRIPWLPGGNSPLRHCLYPVFHPSGLHRRLRAALLAGPSQCPRVSDLGLLFPQPQLGTRWPLSPSHRWWLTGTLPEDCAAHELEEALRIEAGPVDGDGVLRKHGGAGMGSHDAHMHQPLACLLTSTPGSSCLSPLRGWMKGVCFASPPSPWHTL